MGVHVAPVRIGRLAAGRVFNLTAPRWLPEVAHGWTGSAPWLDARYDGLRDLIERTYIEAFDRETGHYAKLEESIRRDGVWNPVIVTTGPLMRRAETELPAKVRHDRKRVVCEWVGGSRLLIAQRLGIDVPVIVNDRANIFPEFGRVWPGTDIASLFKDKPRRIVWQADGCLYVNFFAYGHFSEEERLQRQREQRRTRQGIIAECFRAVEKWRLNND
jgi:hypothetical protein